MKPMIEKIKRIARTVGLKRSRIAATRMYVERQALATVAKDRRRNHGRILCYHSIGQEWMGVNDVTPAQFRRHIDLALEAGYRFVPASKIARDGGAPDELAITFDEGLTSVRTQAAPILKDYGIPWTVFAISEWAEQRDAKQYPHGSSPPICPPTCSMVEFVQRAVSAYATTQA